MKALLLSATAVAGAYFAAAGARGIPESDRLTQLETRLEKLESGMMARDHLILLSSAWVFDRLDLALLEQTGDEQHPEVRALRERLQGVLREGAKHTANMQQVFEQDRIRVASRNYHAAVELRDDVYHRIRVFKEEKIADGPRADERRSRRQAWIHWFEEYMKRTPDPALVKAALAARKAK